MRSPCQLLINEFWSALLEQDVILSEDQSHRLNYHSCIQGRKTLWDQLNSKRKSFCGFLGFFPITCLNLFLITRFNVKKQTKNTTLKHQNVADWLNSVNFPSDFQSSSFIKLQTRAGGSDVRFCRGWRENRTFLVLESPSCTCRQSAHDKTHRETSVISLSLHHYCRRAQKLLWGETEGQGQVCALLLTRLWLHAGGGAFW